MPQAVRRVSVVVLVHVNRRYLGRSVGSLKIKAVWNAARRFHFVRKANSISASLDESLQAGHAGFPLGDPCKVDRTVFFGEAFVMSIGGMQGTS